jgi:acyl dehydratase
MDDVDPRMSGADAGVDTVWTAARRGDRFDAGSRRIDDTTVHELVRAGGFSHPLFTDPEHARMRGFAASPVPGQALLLVLGGLVEATGRFSVGVRALLGYDEVRFLRRVCAGDELHLVVELVGTEPGPEPGLGVVLARLTGSVEGQPVCTALVRHLVEADPV